jgi:uncharacterized membrane protein YkvA (DUF1232 family)
VDHERRRPLILRLLLGAAVALVAVWLLLLVMLAIRRPETGVIGEALRLVPDIVRLLRGLSKDPTVERGVRVRLAIVLFYLALPLDLVPDFIPLLGYADDVIVVSIGLRLVVRHAGADKVREHWSGTGDGLAVLASLCRLPQLADDS